MFAEAACGAWFAHIGRAAIAALDAGQVPPFGEIGTEGGRYTAGPEQISGRIS